jgi:hypothetical protein
MHAVCADDNVAFFDGAVREVNTHSCVGMLDSFKRFACLDL